MSKKHDTVVTNDDSELTSNCLDMIWDDDITDIELEIMLETVKCPKILQKLSRYQYNQDIMQTRISTNYVNIVQSVNEKIVAAENKDKRKEERKFNKYQRLIKTRSFFWPFSLPVLALCTVFFVILSVTNNLHNIKKPQNLVTRTNNPNQYLFQPDNYSLHDATYIRVSTLEDISENFNANRLYSVNPNNN